VQVIPVMDGEVVVGIEIILSDLSEQEQTKALTQQLEHRAVLGDYTAAFAHDVRNPINSIYTGIQLLAAKLKPDDPNQEVIGRIQNDCTRLNHLMESFLAFSRPIEPRVEDIDVEVFLQRIIDRWRPKFAKVNVTPVLYVEESIERMRGDSRSLDQVFTNLISNALDAMSTSGDTLAIRAVMNREIAGHPQVEITVSDNGPGIPEDLREHIFEPFVTTRKQGTGLGLAITKQIVTAHKGSISVDSFAGGTVFTIRIPASLGEE
jgi:signal transduction histidine kinase